MRQSGTGALRQAAAALRRERLLRAGTGLVAFDIAGFGHVKFSPVKFDALCKRFSGQTCQQVLASVNFATGEEYVASTWVEAVAVYAEAVAGIGL